MLQDIYCSDAQELCCVLYNYYASDAYPRLRCVSKTVYQRLVMRKNCDVAFVLVLVCCLLAGLFVCLLVGWLAGLYVCLYVSVFACLFVWLVGYVM